MGICCEVLGWRIFDIKFLENLIEELEQYTKFCLDDVINEIEFNCLEKNNINSYIYEVLYLNEQVIKEVCGEYTKHISDEIDELESNIYCNYSDSGYDSKFNNWDWEEFNELNDEEKKNYVEKFLKEFGLEV